MSRRALKSETNMQAEVAKLAGGLGLRRVRSNRRIGLGRHGRSGKGYSLVLMENLRSDLNEDSRQDEDIAHKRSIALKDLRAYRRLIGSYRERHRTGR